MDFQKAERPLADSKVYLIIEGVRGSDETMIVSAFATKEAAEIARSYYDSRKISWSRCWYEIKEVEVLDKAGISESQGAQAPAVGS